MLLFCPKLMEVEKVTTIGDTPILQFHDYGRKSSFFGRIVTFHYTSWLVGILILIMAYKKTYPYTIPYI